MPKIKPHIVACVTIPIEKLVPLIEGLTSLTNLPPEPTARYVRRAIEMAVNSLIKSGYTREYSREEALSRYYSNIFATKIDIKDTSVSDLSLDIPKANSKYTKISTDLGEAESTAKHLDEVNSRYTDLVKELKNTVFKSNVSNDKTRDTVKKILSIKNQKFFWNIASITEECKNGFWEVAKVILKKDMTEENQELADIITTNASAIHLAIITTTTKKGGITEVFPSLNLDECLSME